MGLLAVAPTWAAEPEIKLNRLKPSLASLTRGERGTVTRALDLIRRGEHTAALAQLTELSRANPANSATRVVLAYGLLQAGNLVGAFDEARQAEAAPDHNSYVCLFLARIARLVGDNEVCRRELGHVRQAGTDKKEAGALERQLANHAAPQR
jgi:Flp pilus assembly protein TadD